MLKFSFGNAKLPAHTAIFSLPAGYTCPNADICLSRANPKTGKIEDGPHTQVRCYAASGELRPNVRKARWHNLNLIRATDNDKLPSLILSSLLESTPVCRVHDSGDFFSLPYMQSWVKVALMRPKTKFYFYTKSISYWLRLIKLIGDGHTPGHLPNIVPTASLGGKEDSLAIRHGLRTARIVQFPEESAAIGLEIDHDDSLASNHGKDFALLVHGSQPKGSQAALNISELRRRAGIKGGNIGYGLTTKKLMALPVV